MSNFDGYRNISYTYVIVPWLQVRREGVFRMDLKRVLCAIVG